MFIKGEQNHRWPDGKYKNNDTMNANILNLVIP